MRRLERQARSHPQGRHHSPDRAVFGLYGYGFWFTLARSEIQANNVVIRRGIRVVDLRRSRKNVGA